MAGSPDQKRKLFYILEYLKIYTDNEHSATVADIQKYLERFEITAERKSIYTDIEILQDLGYDIETVHGNGRRNEYRLASRAFEPAELKLLVDVVGASRFVTRKKSLELIEKLTGLASVHHADALRRNVFVDRRVKTMNERIYYSIDAIHEAIRDDRKLSFRYFSYTAKKEKVLRKDGAPYVVSPIALTFSEENYYLYAWSDEAQQVRTYRVDRMQDSRVLEERRSDNDVIRAFDPAAAEQQAFSMFGGETRNVTLWFEESLATVVIDRFGPDVMMVPRDNGFTVHVDVRVSEVFLGWVFGFFGRAKILAPADVRKQFEKGVEAAAQWVRE